MKDITFISQEDIASIHAKDSLWDISGMTDAGKTPEQQILIERLGGFIQPRGKVAARALSAAIGANNSYIGQLLNGRGGMPSAARLQAIAEELETTTDYLLGKSEDPTQPVSEVGFRDMPALWGPSDADGIPVLGTAFCDDLAVETDDGTYEVERVLLETDHTIRMIARPPALWAARDAYAIYFQGTSMETRYRQGDLGIVDPRRPPGPGDDVVVQLNDGAGGRDVVTVLVKELVRATGAYIELRQLNPEQTFRIPRARVAQLHRIVPLRELLGG